MGHPETLQTSWSYTLGIVDGGWKGRWKETPEYPSGGWKGRWEETSKYPTGKSEERVSNVSQSLMLHKTSKEMLWSQFFWLLRRVAGDPGEEKYNGCVESLAQSILRSSLWAKSGMHHVQGFLSETTGQSQRVTIFRIWFSKYKLLIRGGAL